MYQQAVSASIDSVSTERISGHHNRRWKIKQQPGRPQLEQQDIPSYLRDYSSAVVSMLSVSKMHQEQAMVGVVPARDELISAAEDLVHLSASCMGPAGRSKFLQVSYHTDSCCAAHPANKYLRTQYTYDGIVGGISWVRVRAKDTFFSCAVFRVAESART